MYHYLLELKYKTERKEFFYSIAIWVFGKGLVQVFIPIYLIVSGFELWQVFLFFAIQETARTINVPLVLKSIGKFGAKHVFSFSIVFPILFYALLSLILKVPVFFYIAAVMAGLSRVYAATAYHLHLSKITPNDSRGRTLAGIMTLQIISLAAAPLFGGLLIERFGIISALVVAILMLLISISILLRTKEVSPRHILDTKLLHFRKVARDSFANGFNNIRLTLDAVAWPIFMYLLLVRFDKIGYIESVSLAAGIVVVVVMGRLLDHSSRKKIFIKANIAHSIIAALRVFAVGTLSVLLFNILHNIFNRARGLSWQSIFHDNLSKHPRSEYFLWFESFGALFSAIAMIGFIFIALELDMKLTLTIAILSASVFGLFSNIVKHDS